MKKLLIPLFFVLAGVNASAMTIKTGDNTIDVYSSIRAFTVFNHTAAGDQALAGRSRGYDISQFTVGLQSNSRLGVRWTQGNIFLHTEMGLGGPDQTPQPTLRYLYGDYKFAGGKSGRIRIGQMPTISNTHSYYDRKLSQDHGLQGYGTMLEARRLGINYEIGGFSVSAISMRQDAADITGRFSGGAGFGNVMFSEIMPRIEAAYSIIPNLKVAGSYVKSSVVADNSATEAIDKLYHVDAGHITVIANPKISNKVQLAMSGFYSVNAGLYRMVSIGGGYNEYEAVNRGDWARPELKSGEAGSRGEFDNTTAYGGAIGVAVDKFEVGFGIQSAGNDRWEDTQTGMGVYANYKIRMSNFRITPEIGYLHSGDRRVNRGQPAQQDTRGFQAGIQFRLDI
jgi:hypothetical protein